MISLSYETKRSRLLMTTIKIRIHVEPDGTLSGKARGLPVGDHDAEVVVRESAQLAPSPNADTLFARVRAIQDEVARLPVLDRRSPEEIIGYNERGHFD
jgi:hypothetical protein